MALKQKRIPIKHLDPIARSRDFNEVNMGYIQSEAQAEAARCLQCKIPKCVAKCPAKIHIPAFILQIQHGNNQDALNIISQSSFLPSICSRVCPQERQCESKCIVGLKGEPVAIGTLERFACDNGTYPVPKIGASSGKSVAIIGAGPSGIACAIQLRMSGHAVTIYDSFSYPGGAVQYGIPFFRLTRSVRDAAFSLINSMEITFIHSTIVGKDISFDELKKKYDALFFGIGADLPRKLAIPGEDLRGVMTAADYLASVNTAILANEPPSSAIKPHVPEHLVVIGCGDTALDVARTAVRLGSKVTVIYRRTLHEAPALREDIVAAQQEGVVFRCLLSQQRVIGSHCVEGLEVQQLQLVGDPDSGQDHSQQQLLPIDGSVFIIPCDMIVSSVGVLPNTAVIKSVGFEVDNWNKIKVTNFQTSIHGIFAGGDTTNGDITVVRAMADGKNAGLAIDEYLKKQ